MMVQRVQRVILVLQDRKVSKALQDHKGQIVQWLDHREQLEQLEIQDHKDQQGLMVLTELMELQA